MANMGSTGTVNISQAMMVAAVQALICTNGHLLLADAHW